MTKKDDLIIYFAGSIRGGREDRDLYAQLIKHLSKYGKVLTEHVGDSEISGDGENSLPDERIFVRDINWLKQADIVVAEVTTPSLGVGYEIGLAQAMNKPVLCLYRLQDDKKLSAMISGNPGVKLLHYNTHDDAFKFIDEYFITMGRHK